MINSYVTLLDSYLVTMFYLKSLFKWMLTKLSRLSSLFWQFFPLLSVLLRSPFRTLQSRSSMVVVRLYSSTHEKVCVEIQERVSDSEFVVLGNMEFDRVFGDFHCVWTVDGRRLPLIKKIREIRRFAEFIVKVI